MPQLLQTWFLDLSRLRCNQPQFRRLDLAQYEGMILINDKLYVIMMQRQRPDVIQESIKLYVFPLYGSSKVSM